MNYKNRIKLFLVDDDAVSLKLSEIQFLEHADFIIETFPTGELCIKNLSHEPDIIVLDYHLNGINKNAMNGIETLDKIKRYDSDIQVIMLSSQDEIDIAIDCMHHHAYDYIVKSETAFIHLKKSITNIFKHRKLEKVLNWYKERT